MRKIYAAPFTFLLAVLSSGCGSPDAEAEADSPATEAASANVLHEFNVAGVRYRILDASLPGSPAVILEESAPLNVAGGTPLAQLLDAHPNLTELETYLALAPNGDAPAEQLVATHAVETSLLGRADDAIVRISFVPSGLVQKSLSGCRTVVRDLLRSSGPASDITTHAEPAFDMGDWSLAQTYGWPWSRTGLALAVAACVDSNSPRAVWGEIKGYRDLDEWVNAEGWVRPGYWFAWRWSRTSFNKTLGIRAWDEVDDSMNFQVAGGYAVEIVK